jgi:hypothetical protein
MMTWNGIDRRIVNIDGESFFSLFSLHDAFVKDDWCVYFL